MRKLIAGPLVARAAFLAAWLRLAAPRFFALELAWRDSAICDAAACPSRFRPAEVTARDRFREGVCDGPDPLALSRAACLRVLSEVVPSLGGGSFTPARRALDKPIAIACLAERAACFPSRT